MTADDLRALAEMLGTALLGMVLFLVKSTKTKVESLDRRSEKMHVALVGYDDKGGVIGDVRELKERTTALDESYRVLARRVSTAKEAST